MYFESRAEAGEILGKKLYEQYRYENCAVLAMNNGGVLVGQKIASHLRTLLMLLVTESIEVPGEGLTFGSVSQSGNFTYDGGLSRFEIAGYTSEFNSYLQEKKREAFQKINRLIGDAGTVDTAMLRGRNVILVSDGFDAKTSFEAVLDFLKPIRVQRIIAASPVSCTAAVNKLHALVDEIHILDVKANYISTNHYYDDNNIPEQEEIISFISQNILNWQ
ncbi:MAG: phosphoribosyltransferase family protein [Candidatus Nanosyncoccaceae bacterium]|jgi:predicted phosphoribosyltransferase